MRQKSPQERGSREAAIAVVAVEAFADNIKEQTINE